MPTQQEIGHWEKTIRTRYKNYLKTSFYFKDAGLRESFARALDKYELVKGPIPEPARRFLAGVTAEELAAEFFPGKHKDLSPALKINDKINKLHSHQEQALRSVFDENRNVVVATGTASGKTESFLYPILFELYRQHLNGDLGEPGVRALILYPMNALANDQRERLGKICQALKDADADFKPTFGQYIGETPKHENDHRRHAKDKKEKRLPGELVYRKEMRENPPHILLTNYSMLEYLLIRPKDSALFDDGRGKRWKFIVLDEAHQYRGVKGMEIGMLIRRLKQRLQEGGKRDSDSFRCIATSATLTSGEGKAEQKEVADFAHNLFDEEFAANDVVFGEKQPPTEQKTPQRFHLFMRALEGAFLSHQNGEDGILLNRKSDNDKSIPIEIALCRECGQHYYVGHAVGGSLFEANRDPGGEVQVEFYRPVESDDEDSVLWLCRVCGKIAACKPDCKCGACILVKLCETSEDNPDQMKKCDACGYTRGSVGDPVQEIVHGADGPNTVIASALHRLLQKPERQKILSFADSRQEAAFFAWYAEDSYKQIRDRNLILRAMRDNTGAEGLSPEDLANRLENNLSAKKVLFSESDSDIARKRALLTTIFRELVTSERRLSLAGVGLVKWAAKIPDALVLPPLMFEPPWEFDETEARDLFCFLLDNLRLRGALALPDGADAPSPDSVFLRWSPQKAVCNGERAGRNSVFAWWYPGSSSGQFLLRLLAERGVSDKEEAKKCAKKIMDALWDCIQDCDRNARANGEILSGTSNNSYRLNPAWLRAHAVSAGDIYECKICRNISAVNIRGICPRWRCQGNLKPADSGRLAQNHYRELYEDADMPLELRAAEHTAQLTSDEARKRQDEFKRGRIHLLSTSTTFEVGVDLGDLEVAFLRNVPPESFNYTQRTGRAGRGETPGLALTYCRRNPHDLYHFQDPESRLINGETRAPQLHLQNKRIIVRHMTTVALSAFFNHDKNAERFKNMECFVGGDWHNPRATEDFKNFCGNNRARLEAALKSIVPENMHDSMGLLDGEWVEFITVARTDKHREINGGRCLEAVEEETLKDYRRLSDMEHLYSAGRDHYNANKMKKQLKAIEEEQVLAFLSRKAVIPKYGFPVDAVQLDVSMSGDKAAHDVSLQRDLSQAIAEYAPESKIIANKKEWESSGIKIVSGKELPTINYFYNALRGIYTEWPDGKEPPDGARAGKSYLCPKFGFVASKKPKDPSGRPRRFYTTRPFFLNFDKDKHPVVTENISGVKVTEALPGHMVVLCEGEKGGMFYLCTEDNCGSGFKEKKRTHNTPFGFPCRGTLKPFALGHKFVTDVVQMRFGLTSHSKRLYWDAYSLAYAVLLGAADALDVPNTDLNTTIAGSDGSAELAIVLYDNVPGGAGLVASLKNEIKLKEALEHARVRVRGDCECGESCYGCLRSYRNQFAHANLNRTAAFDILNKVLTPKNGDL